MKITTVNGKAVIHSPQMPGDLLIPDMDDNKIFYRVPQSDLDDPRVSEIAKYVYIELLSMGKRRTHDVTRIASIAGLSVEDTTDALIELDEHAWDITYARGW